MKLNKREFRLLILAVIIVGGGSLIKWGILPVVVQYQTMEQKVKMKEQKWENKQRLLKKREKYKKTLEQTKGEVKQLNSLIFTGDINQAQLRALEILDHQLKKSGIKVDSKSVRVVEKEDVNYKVMVYDFSLQGYFNQLIEFLNNINRNQQLLMINKLQLRRNNEETKQLQINLGLKIIVKSQGISVENRDLADK
ncbi:hypothetical protein [Sporohalobacter salinus]|uniref:hypothetical protein n=1 Tax=Sporohalobacter salinus TaxID=1494606 RepID=UPI0019613BE2|nr:hypothetical protein [Sporohalobacter salinus]MBM7623788.1 hypothetical protein [Sporohalobacter salinus]